ncbi:MAG: NosD domain-containing protein [Candidatus Thorarchaeota archaeon]
MAISTMSMAEKSDSFQALGKSQPFRGPTLLQYTPHDPITIENDDQLANTAVAGSGTAADPFIFEGWQIAAATKYAIKITGTTQCFIIRNCWVEAICVSHCPTYGIYLHNIGIGTATITNNTCQNSNYGLCLEDNAENTTVTYNTFSHNVDGGLIAYGSGNSTISHNIFQNNGEGIFLWGCGQSTVTDNLCQNNTRRGMYLKGVPSSIIANNTSSQNSDPGILVEYSANSTITNNTFLEDGLDIWENSLEDYLSYLVENNWVNGLPLGFLTDQQELNVTLAYGQLFLISCTDVLIEGHAFSNTAVGIALYYCSAVQIRNTTSQNNRYGITLHQSDSATIVNNNCSRNSVGMWISQSNNVSIVNNNCSLNSLDGIDFESSGSLIVNNSFNGNGRWGMEVGGSNCVVANNTGSRNAKDGIRLYGANFFSVADNICQNNKESGISIENTDNCVVAGNRLETNNGYGICLGLWDEGSDNNVLYQNFFIKNGASPQAYDDDVNNTWYDPATKEGNYWSDYAGTEAYHIGGHAGTSDRYPLDEYGNPYPQSTEKTGMPGWFFLGCFFLLAVRLAIPPKHRKSLGK